MTFRKLNVLKFQFSALKFDVWKCFVTVDIFLKFDFFKVWVFLSWVFKNLIIYNLSVLIFFKLSVFLNTVYLKIFFCSEMVTGFGVCLVYLNLEYFESLLFWHLGVYSSKNRLFTTPSPIQKVKNLFSNLVCSILLIRMFIK